MAIGLSFHSYLHSRICHACANRSFLLIHPSCTFISLWLAYKPVIFSYLLSFEQGMGFANISLANSDFAIGTAVGIATVGLFLTVGPNCTLPKAHEGARLVTICTASVIEKYRWLFGKKNISYCCIKNKIWN